MLSYVMRFSVALVGLVFLAIGVLLEVVVCDVAGVVIVGGSVLELAVNYCELRSEFINNLSKLRKADQRIAFYEETSERIKEQLSAILEKVSESDQLLLNDTPYASLVGSFRSNEKDTRSAKELKLGYIERLYSITNKPLFGILRRELPSSVLQEAESLVGDAS